MCRNRQNHIGGTNRIGRGEERSCEGDIERRSVGAIDQVAQIENDLLGLLEQRKIIRHVLDLIALVSVMLVVVIVSLGA